MKHSRGNLSASIIPILILTSIAATGWYYYFDEVEQRNVSEKDNSTRLEKQGKTISELNSRITKLLEKNASLKSSLASEKKSFAGLKSRLNSIESEKADIKSRLKQQIDELSATGTALATDNITLQISSDSLQAEVSLLQQKLKSEKVSQDALNALLEKSEGERLASEGRYQEQLDTAANENTEARAVISSLQSELLSTRESKQNLTALLADTQADIDRLKTELASATSSKQKLSTLLSDSRAETAAMASKLEQEVKRVTLTTAELEAELERRREAQESLNKTISTVSGERSMLQAQLEQEQANKRKIANLKNRLEQELNESRVEILQLKNQMTIIKMTSEILFSSGSAEITPAGKKVLSIIAESLNTYPDRAISVEGHTDNVPVTSNSQYESNWELSTARGLAAVDYFQAKNHVDPKRLMVVGYGEFHPVSTNETTEGRQQNRRIEIRMLAPNSVEVIQN